MTTFNCVRYSFHTSLLCFESWWTICQLGNPTPVCSRTANSTGVYEIKYLDLGSPLKALCNTSKLLKLIKQAVQGIFISFSKNHR